ncbi:MAG: S41 family peptidase [Bacteroidales bacterium]|nr:S41 family peptidase [Bacteroidales bacterium]
MKKILFVILLIFSQLCLAQNQKAKPSETTQKLATTMYIIDNFYVDSTDMPKLTEEAIIAMLKSLDPHSAYIAAKDVQKANEELVGSFEGIGVTFQILRDTILVVSAVPGGPSEKVGIMAGDRIVKIDGEDAFGKKVNNEYVTKHLRGEKGTKVLLGIKRGDDPELIDFEIVRDKIPLNSINTYFMVDKKIGYIKLDKFSQQSVEEFEKALKDLKNQGMQSLIFDLRGNSGGYLQTAFGLGNEFLGKDKMVVFTEGLRAPKQVFMTDKNGDFCEGRLVVLIDEGSASASEIVSGAIQDWDRGVLIGRRSFGKGLVQRPFNLPDGAQIRLTTARYHTPTGRCIQRSYEKGSEEYFKEMTKRLEHGEYYHADSIQFPDSLKYYTLTCGRTVYGGGGIMPDIFMPADTTYSTKLLTDLIRKTVFNTYCVDYVLKNRETIKKNYPDFEKFNKKFKVDDAMMEDFKKVADQKGVKWNDEQFERSTEWIQLRIKAIIAQNVWDIDKFYQVVAKEDKMIDKAIEIINSKKEYDKILGN